MEGTRPRGAPRKQAGQHSWMERKFCQECKIATTRLEQLENVVLDVVTICRRTSWEKRTLRREEDMLYIYFWPTSMKPVRHWNVSSYSLEWPLTNYLPGMWSIGAVFSNTNGLLPLLMACSSYYNIIQYDDWFYASPTNKTATHYRVKEHKNKHNVKNKLTTHNKRVKLVIVGYPEQKLLNAGVEHTRCTDPLDCVQTVPNLLTGYHYWRRKNIQWGYNNRRAQHEQRTLTQNKLILGEAVMGYQPWATLQPGPNPSV